MPENAILRLKGAQNMTISEKIYILRRDAEMSQDELAEKLDVSRQSVSKWESGRVLPDSAKILALSELFGVTTDFLLKDSEEFDSDLPVENDYFETASDELHAMQSDGNENTAEFKAVTDTVSVNRKKKGKTGKKIVAAVLAVCLVAAAIIVPWKMGLLDSSKGGTNPLVITEEPIDYPYILVHGLGGWGPESKINETVPYWGNSAGNLAQYMTSQDKETYEASVGPFSSTWDRTCELYAQLTGTVVDYGEAHSKLHGHNRYGREYTKPLFEGWGTKTPGGQVKKINLVGHSFGGETVRMLASLLAYGDEAEKNSDSEVVSPLFTGGKADWVNSVTTLCSPHNGSTLFYVVNRFKLVDTILAMVYAAGGVSSITSINNFYDFRLEQFGITDTTDVKSVINEVFSKGVDNAAYDLSPDGAEELNRVIKTVDGIYYFSYSYSTTQEGPLTGNQVHTLTTNPVLWATADMMGRYSKNTVSGYMIDETWLENDGLVNVVSARYPFSDEWQDFDSENIVRGKWNVMPLKTGDHGTVIGLLADVQQTKTFYNELYAMIDGLPRK